MAGRWDQALAAEHAAVPKIFDLLEATSDSSTGGHRFCLNKEGLKLA